jgi:hypothetical protein
VGSSSPGGVGVDELAVDGEIESVGDDSVDLEHGLGRESLSASIAVGDEVGVAGVEVRRSECVQPDGTDPRCDVVVDHPPVPVGGVPGEAALGGQPCGGHEPAHIEGARRVGSLTLEPLLERDGVRLVGASGVPSAAFASGDRVVAVVRDDVEAMVALHDVGHLRPSARRVVNPKISRRHREAS